MSHDDETTSDALRDLRRAYRRQRYDGDLGAIVQPARQRSFWPILAAAAGLALCALIAWQVATQLPPTQPIAGQVQRPSTQPEMLPAKDRPPQVHTLELNDPAQSVTTEAVGERRPVLPGLLVMHGPRATPPPRPSFAARPTLSFIQSTTSENEQGSLP